MTNAAQTRWEALLAGLNPDRSAREILFDPLIEDWAFAGLSDAYREQIKEKQHGDQERAVLLDRLRWIVQKRLAGREQEIMLLYLAGCSQVQIADRLGVSRSTVRRSLADSGERLMKIVAGSGAVREGWTRRSLTARLLPLDTEDDYHAFLDLIAERAVRHVALGTFADLREALVVYEAENQSP